MRYGFDIAEGTARTMWGATDGTSTYYMGQLVAYTAASKAQTPGTFVPLAVAAGAWDTTNFQVIAGIVVGFSDKTQLWGSYGQYRAGVVTQADQASRAEFSYNSGMGMYAPNDPQVLLEVALIDATSLIRGPIQETAADCTVETDTGGADTTGYTTPGTSSASSFTPVANTCSIYCRTGKNMGLWRTTNDTSTTAADVTVAFPYDVASGDTFVRFSLKQGYSLLYLGATPTGMYIDNTLSGGTTNYFGAIVYRIKADVAGEEFAEFKFDPIHFTNIRS
jgi:hypothetical protein